MEKEGMKKTKKLTQSVSLSQPLTLAGAKFGEPIPCICNYVCDCVNQLDFYVQGYYWGALVSQG